MAAPGRAALLLCMLAATAGAVELPALKRQRERYERQHARPTTPRTLLAPDTPSAPGTPPAPDNRPAELDRGLTIPPSRLGSVTELTPRPEPEPEPEPKTAPEPMPRPAATATEERSEGAAAAGERVEGAAAAGERVEGAAAAGERVEGAAPPADRQVALQTQQVDEPSVVSAGQADTAKVEETTIKTEVVTYEAVPDKAYAVFDHHGRICILATLSADLEIIYYTEYDERKKMTVRLPDDADVTGACARDDAKPRISFRWDHFEFSMLFKENDIGNKWYVSDMKLEYDVSQFAEARPMGRQKLWMDVQMQHTLHLFGTPVDKAYFCTSKQDLDLYNGDGVQSATVMLWDLHLQPYVRNGQFGASVNCPGVPVGRRRINETVPMAVGSTLAAVTLLTIAGYAVWRHFKVKKFNYDTME